jgi:CBS domain containing-hemolysin-like protein
MINLILLVVLILLAAVTAASETAVVAASRLKLRRLAAEGSRAAKILLKILETPERFFGTILVANNVVDVLLASIVTAMTIYFVGNESKGVFLATVIVSAVIIIAEVSGKTLAAKNPVKLSLALAEAVRFLIWVFSPVVKVLAAITNAIVNLVGGRTSGKASLVLEEEVRSFIKLGELEDSLHREKYKMLSKVFDFSDVLVRAVMTPKEKIVSVDVDAKIDDILSKALESGYSRLPVYKGSTEHIIGMINMKDLLSLSTSNGLIVMQDIIYPPVFIDSSKKVAELLKDFQKGHTHIAIVTGPGGSLEGLITLEDLLEEIVGEINDEYDVRGSARRRI